MEREHLPCTEPEPQDWELSSCWPRRNIFSNKRAIDLSNSSFYCCCFLIMCKTMKDIHFGLSRMLDKVEANRKSPSFSVYFKWLNRNLYKSSRTTTAIEKNTPEEYFLWHLIHGAYRPINLCLFTCYPPSQIKWVLKISVESTVSQNTRTIITLFYSMIAFAKI